MVDDPVDDCGGHVVVSEDGSPAGEFQVGGQDEAAFLVGLGDDLEQQPCALGIDREVAQLIDLCRYRHRSTYADMVTMPRGTGLLLCAGCLGVGLSA